MKFTYRLISLLLGALLMGGCSSTGQQKPTALESVQDAKASVDQTNGYIDKAEDTLAAFEKSITDLKKDAASSDKMRGKQKFAEALSRMDRRVDEAHTDLKRLKAANMESWEVYRNHLDTARDDMQKSFKEMSE